MVLEVRLWKPFELASGKMKGRAIFAEISLVLAAGLGIRVE